MGSSALVEAPSKKGRKHLRPFLFGCAGVIGLVALAGLLSVILRTTGLVHFLPGFGRTPIPVSGSKSVNLKPLPGVRITAPRNALDQSRDVRFEDLGEAGLDRLHRELGSQSSALPLRAFELDTGMAPEDRYPGNMTLSFDLKKLDIPESLWQDVRVVQIEDDGSRLNPETRFDGRTLQVDVDRNSLIGFVVISALASLIPADMVWKDSQKIPGGPYIPFALPDCPGFVIHLGAKELPLGNTKEVQRVLDAMNAMRKPLGLPLFGVTLKKPPWIGPIAKTMDPGKISTFKEIVDAEARIEENQAYVKLNDHWRNPEWIKRNIVPASVVNLAVSLSHARSYLKEKRKFRYPTYAIDVFLPTQHMTGFGYQDDLWFGHPFMLINKTMIPDVVPGETGWTDHDQSCFDGLNLTLLHELFHVIQTRYFWTPEVFGLDTWFFEATAVALEAEAKDTYLSTPDWHVTQWHGTVRDYAGFRDPLSFAWQTTHQHQQHGYSVSYFFEYLRDTYFVNNPDAFLPRLMEDYSGFRGGALASLYRVATGDTTAFGKAFRQFCRSHDDDMFFVPLPSKLRPKLSKKSPVYLWKHTKFLELRSPVLEVRLRMPSGSTAKKEGDVVLVARDEAASMLEMPGAYEVRWWNALEDKWRPLSKRNHVTVPSDWKTRLRGQIRTQKIDFQDCSEIVSVDVTKGADLVRVLERDGIPFRLERIEYQLFTGVDSWNRSADKGITIFALFKPAKTPTITVDREKKTLEFEVEPSILAKKKLIEGYLVRFKLFGKGGGPGGTSRRQVGPELTVFLKLGESTIQADPLFEAFQSTSKNNPLLKKGFGSVTPSEIRDWIDVSQVFSTHQEELEITYREVVDLKQKIWGPESDRVIGALPPPDQEVFDPSGHWEGTTWIIRTPVVMDIQKVGSSIKGTWAFSGSSGRFDGEWKDEEKGWELTLWTGDSSEADMGNIVLMTLYLRRVARHGLWLGAPPTVLRNAGWQAAEKSRREEQTSRGGFLEWIGWKSAPTENRPAPGPEGKSP